MDGGVGPLGGKKRSALRGERGVHLSGRGGDCPKSERPHLYSRYGVEVEQKCPVCFIWLEFLCLGVALKHTIWAHSRDLSHASGVVDAC